MVSVISPSALLSFEDPPTWASVLIFWQLIEYFPWRRLHRDIERNVKSLNEETSLIVPANHQESMAVKRFHEMERPIIQNHRALLPYVETGAVKINHCLASRKFGHS